MPDLSTQSMEAPAMATPRTLFGKYEVGKLLGCGSFARVHRAREVATGSLVAIKCISKRHLLSSGLAPSVEREVAIMRRLRHPNVVRLHEVLASRDNIYLVMEYVRGGELFAALADRGRLAEPLARRYFRGLVAAVGYCHARGVFHRDLKPENIILEDGDEGGGGLKVTDFGLGAIAGEGAAKKDAMFHTLCGTPAYVAPEILAKKGYDAAKVDMWSCGVILYVLVAGYLPFNDANLMRMYRKIYRGDYRCPKWVSPELKKLISRLLDTNPTTRMDVEGVLRDPWFRKGVEERELEALGRFHHDIDMDMEWEPKIKKEEPREMNAFDIISMSSGCDLSGLFEEAFAAREVFAAAGPAERVMGEVEEAGRREGGGVVRRGTCMALVVKGASRVGRVEVHRLDPGTVVVESEWTGSAAREWFEGVKLRLMGSGPGAPVGV